LNPDELRQHLVTLHDELRRVTQVDPQSNRLLADLEEDIRRLTAAQAAGVSPSAPGLPDRLERLAVQFEADHPTLAASSRRLIDLLGKLGM
jgi:uncharacterized protein YgbK (DUF1537 family)